MAIEKIKMSQAQYDKIKADLDYMETVRTREVAEQLKEARGFGDLSENSEYDEAKSEQGKLYSKIAELHNLLENAEIVEADVVEQGVVAHPDREVAVVGGHQPTLVDFQTGLQDLLFGLGVRGIACHGQPSFCFRPNIAARFSVKGG